MRKIQSRHSLINKLPFHIFTLQSRAASSLRKEGDSILQNKNDTSRDVLTFIIYLLQLIPWMTSIERTNSKIHHRSSCVVLISSRVPTIPITRHFQLSKESIWHESVPHLPDGCRWGSQLSSPSSDRLLWKKSVACWDVDGDYKGMTK